MYTCAGGHKVRFNVRQLCSCTGAINNDVNDFSLSSFACTDSQYY